MEEKRKIRIAAWNVRGPMGSGPFGLMKNPSATTSGKIRSLLEHEDPDFAFLQEVPPLDFLENLDLEQFSPQISSRIENYCRGIMAYVKKDFSVSVTVVPGDPRFPVAAGYIVRQRENKETGQTARELFRFLGIWNAPYKTGSQDDYFDNFKSILKYFRSFCHDGQNLIIAGDTNLILHAGAYRGNDEMLAECAERREELDRKLKELDLPAVYPVADNADTFGRIYKDKHTGEVVENWYRCDLLFVSDSLREGLTARLGGREIYIDNGKFTSDHLPILAEFYA